MKYLYTLLLVSLTLVSCKKSEEKSVSDFNIDLDAAIEKAESRRGADKNASGGNKCLLAYAEKYDQLLNDSWVTEASGLSANEAEKEYSKIMSNTEYHEYKYRWKSDRKHHMETMGMSFEIDVMNMIAVKGIKAVSLFQFENMYRAMTEEESDTVDSIIEDIAEGKSGDKDADKAVKKAEEMGVSSDMMKNVMGDMKDVLKDVANANEAVSNLGDAANWNPVTKELSVLQNGVKFDVYSDISDDTNRNKEAAVALAKKILSKCK